MLNTDPISNRAISAFAVSVGTSLALPFEKVFNDQIFYDGLKISFNINNQEKTYSFTKGFLFQRCLEYGPPRISAYWLHNNTNGIVYVGSTKNIVTRLNSHKAMLRNNNHRNLKLQESFNKTDKHWFDICIIFTDTREEAYDIEQYLLDYFKNKENLCNISTNARINRLNLPMPEHVKQLLLEKNLGKKHTLEHIRKRSIQNIGRKPSMLAIEKLAKYNSTKIVSEETKLKLRNINLGKKHSDETKNKISKNWNGFNGLKKLQEINKKQVIIDNIKYDSITEAAIKLNVHKSTIYNRLHNKFGIFNNYSYV